MHSRWGHLRRLVSASLLAAACVGASSTAFAQAAPPATTGAKEWPESPAKGADPPLLPPPVPGVPTSTSGSDVAPPANVSPSAVAGPEPPRDDARARIRELEARMALDEARLKTLEDDVGLLRHIKLQGFVQAQYLLSSVNEAASPNRVNGVLPPGIGPNSVIARSDGTTTNTNLFRLRRTRLRTIYETDVMRVFLQLDFMPAGGPAPGQGTIARNAEATGIANWSKDVKTELTAGLFMVPFRRETYEVSMYRPFIERTWASQNLFPTERDIGFHVKTFVKKDRYVFDVGGVNGTKLGERTFVLLPDLNRSKDFYAAFDAKLGPLSVGIAGYAGTGAVVDTTNLRVKNYGRYGVNFALTAAYTFLPRLGESRLLSELIFAQNMDTGVIYPFALPAIPQNLGDDVRNVNQRGLYVRVEQDLTRWGIAGFRYDMYTPNSAIANNARDTYTFLAGARFTKLLRLMNEVSYAIDNVHAENTPAPSRHIFGYTAWLQGSFY